MKLILQILAFVALFSIIYLVILNGNDSITLQLWAPRYDAVAQTVYHTTKTLNLAFWEWVCLSEFVRLFRFIWHRQNNCLHINESWKEVQ